MAESHKRGEHSHAVGNAVSNAVSNSSSRRLALVLALTTAFMGVEVAGGLISGSLALLADAGHMLTDVLAIVVALAALWLGRQEATRTHTYGFRRAEFLGAFVNALSLVALAVWIVIEAVERLGEPQVVLGGVMFWVALAGLAVNVVGLLLLRGHGHANLGLKAAIWHITGDLLGSVGAVTAALVIAFTGYVWADAVVSMFIAALIGVSGAKILYDSAGLLMDRVPAGIDAAAVEAYLEERPEVTRVCDFHIWSVSSQEAMLSAHLVVPPEVERDAFLRGLLGDLQQRFGLAHMTVQLEDESHASCPQQW